MGPAHWACPQRVPACPQHVPTLLRHRCCGGLCRGLWSALRKVEVLGSVTGHGPPWPGLMSEHRTGARERDQWLEAPGPPPMTEYLFLGEFLNPGLSLSVWKKWIKITFISL